jgi:Thioredoxin
VSTAILVLCSLCVTGLAVHRELASTARITNGGAPAKPQYITNWRGFDSLGIRSGPASAPVRIVEFIDYQCPACRAYDGVLRTVAQRHPRDVSWLFIHSPLTIHPFAQQAARAIECATAQDRLSAMREQLFARQDSFGLKPWTAYARQAGVVDTARFCGTPTILINGWMFASPPTLADVEGAIDRALAGKPVFQGGSR